MPLFGGFLFQTFVCVGGVNLFYCINDTDAIFIRKHFSHSAYLGWKQQIEIVLCNVKIHNFTSFHSMNLNACSDASVWNRY